MARAAGYLCLVREMHPGMRLGTQEHPSGVVFAAPRLLGNPPAVELSVVMGENEDAYVETRTYVHADTAALWVSP